MGNEIVAVVGRDTPLDLKPHEESWLILDKGGMEGGGQLGRGLLELTDGHTLVKRPDDGMVLGALALGCLGLEVIPDDLMGLAVSDGVLLGCLDGVEGEW